MVPGGTLSRVNPNGHKETLVPAQWGNKNAVSSGAFAEVADEEVAEFIGLVDGFDEFTPVERVATYDFAESFVRLRRIDGYLRLNGDVKKNGDLEPVQKERHRLSRRLERLGPVVTAAETRVRFAKEQDAIGPDDYIRELKRIAAGFDPNAKARDRIAANCELEGREASREKVPTTVTIIFREDGSTEEIMQYEQ